MLSYATAYVNHYYIYAGRHTPPHPATLNRKPVRHHPRQRLMDTPLRLPVADGRLMLCHIPCSRNAALGAVPECLQ